jgi:hypothetical protein
MLLAMVSLLEAMMYRFFPVCCRYCNEVLVIVRRFVVEVYVPVKLHYRAACDACHHGNECSFLTLLMYMNEDSLSLQ